MKVVCERGEEVLFVFLTISIIKQLHSCVKNNIAQPRVYNNVWVKIKRKIILSGQDFITKYAKGKRSRDALSHM